MNKLSSIVLCLIFFMASYSCNSKQTEQDNLKDFTLNSIKLSIENTRVSTEQQYDELNKKLLDIQLNEVASLWQPKAQKIKTLTSIFQNYLDSLQIRSKELNRINKAELQNKVSELLANIQAIDPQFRFSEPSQLQIGKSETTENIDMNLLLFSIENYIMILENKLVTLCNMNSHYIHDTWGMLSILINQNSKHFNAGDELIIEAGVGEFSPAANPKIKIDGKQCQVNRGHAIYKTKVTGIKGDYSMPIEMVYINTDGEEKTGTTYIYYSIDR